MDDYQHLRESADADVPCVRDGSHSDDITHAAEYATRTGRHAIADAATAERSPDKERTLRPHHRYGDTPETAIEREGREACAAGLHHRVAPNAEHDLSDIEHVFHCASCLEVLRDLRRWQSTR